MSYRKLDLIVGSRSFFVFFLSNQKKQTTLPRRVGTACNVLCDLCQLPLLGCLIVPLEEVPKEWNKCLSSSDKSSLTFCVIYVSYLCLVVWLFHSKKYQKNGTSVSVLQIKAAWQTGSAVKLLRSNCENAQPRSQKQQQQQQKTSKHTTCPRQVGTTHSVLCNAICLVALMVPLEEIPNAKEWNIGT